MARKTSNQTIEKIEKQIDHLKDETYIVDDITPILDSEVIKKNQKATSSPKKKTSTKRVSSTGSSTRKTSTTKKSTSSTKKSTSTTTRKKTTVRDDVVVAPTKKTTKKTTSTKNVRDTVVVSEKPTRTRKTKKSTTKEVEDSIKKKNESLQENVEKIVEAIKEEKVDQELADISLEEFETDGKEIPVDVDNLEKEIEAIAQGEKEEEKKKEKEKQREEEKKKEEEETQKILEDSTFIDNSKKIRLEDDELNFSFEEDKEELSSKDDHSDDTIEILHSGETTNLDQTYQKAKEKDVIEVLSSEKTEDLDKVVKITRSDDYDLDHIDQMEEYDIVSEFEKDIFDDTSKKKERTTSSEKKIVPKSKKKKDTKEVSEDSYQDLEKDLRSLYDRVNDVVEDFDPNAKEEEYIDLTKLRTQTKVKTPTKKKFSFQTLAKNLSLKKDALLNRFRRKKKPVDKFKPIDEKYKPKKVRKDFEKLSKPRPEKRKKVRTVELEEYDDFSILDYINQKVLNFMMIFLAIIFVLMCIAFVLFVVYVSTF